MISELKRSDIRYALFRSKCGNPDKIHTEIFKFYENALKDHGMTIKDFNEKWDISKNDNTKLVFGKTVKEYVSINETKTPTSIKRKAAK